ncbi:valine--tRNA ligase [candidate division WWE3 bacterium]|nr:valine--tRNA ligase [candidate division WWE3 bacterium]
MELPKRPEFNEYEPRLAKQSRESGRYTPTIKPGEKPFTVLLPPPNANDPLHVGHAMYVVEDILCRYHRMKGDPTLFLPGTDHAGIETQFVFEKYLAKEGRSRFDFDRETLYQMIDEFVNKNRGIALSQMERLGFSFDWSREKYTLSPEILDIIFDTFRKLYDDGLLYRDERIVNYCTKCGTGFSNLEVDHEERDDVIYHLDYKTITIATTRPETIFADVAIAVNPTDERYKSLIGKTATIPLINREIPIIADEAVEKDFGTGALKITPGHDPLDYEIGERHSLPRLTVINRAGRLINTPEKYLGMKVKPAREAVIVDLTAAESLVKTEELHHAVGICYRCKNTIEPLLLPQWYVKIKPLVDPVVQIVEQEQGFKVYPLKFKQDLLRWLNTAPDWNISRQIVWGPRIPVWYCLDCNPQIEVTFLSDSKETISGSYQDLKDTYSFETIVRNLQNLIAPIGSTYLLADHACEKCRGNHILRETDTFDTWFSSGQWPLTTLGFPDSKDFKYFYPTSVLDTMWDILPFWIMRMLLFGVYRTGKAPFEVAHLHARVVDGKGKKMSKSKGNVVNPMAVVEKYGADALRLALVFGIAPAADVALGDQKLIGMRNFITKLWNIARFIVMKTPEGTSIPLNGIPDIQLEQSDIAILQTLNELITTTTQSIEKYQFSIASESVYDFVWNTLASQYLESTKNRTDEAAIWTLNIVLITCLKLLHPFIPFITAEIYSYLPNKDAEHIDIADWPKELMLPSN